MNKKERIKNGQRKIVRKRRQGNRRKRMSRRRERKESGEGGGKVEAVGLFPYGLFLLVSLT